MDKIIYTRPEDGGVTVLSPASKADVERTMGPMTEEAYEQYIRPLCWAKDVPADAITPVWVPRNSIPSMEFRDYWRQNGTEIVVEMEFAKIKHMSRIQEMIQKKLDDMGFPKKLNPQIEARLDSETRTELERLRNIPQTFDLSSANTPDKLISLWPEGIENHPDYIKI